MKRCSICGEQVPRYKQITHEAGVFDLGQGVRLLDVGGFDEIFCKRCWNAAYATANNGAAPTVIDEHITWRFDATFDAALAMLKTKRSG